MKRFSKPLGWREKQLILLTVLGILFGILPVLELKTQILEENLGVFSLEQTSITTIQGNTILPLTSLSYSDTKTKKVRVIVTAYSSSPLETDSTPFVTAAGTEVKDGIVANNLLPFGTRVRMPELYGDKIFVVEDRMNWKKGKYHVDVWFSSRQDAINFGSRKTYLEILEG
jgi:3D (Asp-Asp-Asp) domain-containing protein